MAILRPFVGRVKFKFCLTFGLFLAIMRDMEKALSDKKTMTLNLTAAEMDALEEMARKKDLTKTAVIRQALRLYQMVDARVSQGEKLFFEDELQKKKAEIMVLG